MAELSINGANTKGMRDEDGDFEPSADMLVHDFDDEQTLEEEEKLQGQTNFRSEIDDLTREGEMPLHELLKMYGYGAAVSADSDDEGPEEEEEEDVSLNDQSSSGNGNKTDKEDKADKDQRLSSEESPDRSRTQNTAHLLFSGPYSYFYGDGDESEDEDYVPSEEWKKEVNVGPMYQAETPNDLCEYKENEKVYENEDQLLWNPELLPENEVVEFLAEASKRVSEQTGVDAVPEAPLIKDNEEALYELIKCNFNKEEALNRLKFNPKPSKDEPPVWTEEESQEFEKDDGVCVNDFNSVQADKIKLWRRKADHLPAVTNSTDQTWTESVRTEVSQAEASNDNGHQLASETISTTHSDSHSVDHTSSCGSDRTTSNPQVLSSSGLDLSGSTTDTVRRPREDEEDSERLVKKPKTEVEFRTVAAV